MNAIRYGGTLLALLLCFGRPAEAQRAIEQGRPAARDGTVKITNLAGSVRVVGWYRDSVAIAGTLGPEIEELEFTTDDRATRIRVVLRHEYRDRPVGGSDLEVRVPQQSHVAVRTAEGAIEISDVSGAVDLESGTGDIRIEGNPRFVYARSVGGSLDILGMSKIIRASSVAGNVTVRRAGGYLDVSTVSGAIVLGGRNVWEGRAASVSGDIRFEGDFDRGGSFTFENNSGAVDLVLSPRIAADFHVITFSGRLENHLLSSYQPAGSAAEGRGREIIFSTNGGGTRIDVKSFKGTIRIVPAN